jgi:hypothetical protein
VFTTDRAAFATTEAAARAAFYAVITAGGPQAEARQAARNVWDAAAA